MEIVQATLERLRAGRGLTYRNLHVFPLYDNVACEPDYLTMDETLVACGRVVHLALYIQESEESAKQDMAQRRERAEIHRRRAGEIKASSRGVSAQVPAFEFDRVLARVYAGRNPLPSKMSNG